MKLRDYQLECLESILDRYRAGIRHQLVCLPTGTGKTVIFSQFPVFFRMKRRMLVLAHRAELLNQARDKLLAANPALQVEIEQAGRTASESSNVVVASVPTLGRSGSARLTRLDPSQFSIVVIDEAHHATAETYGRIIGHLGLDQPGSRKLLVGFTATPKRSDGVGLHGVFDEISFSRTIPEMMAAGYLAPVAGYRVETDVDLSRVKTRMGDFVVSQLSRAVNVEDRNALVVKAFRELVPDRRTLVFCVDVAHALDLAAAFAHYGIAAAAVTGDTPFGERAEMLAAFVRTPAGSDELHGAHRRIRRTGGGRHHPGAPYEVQPTVHANDRPRHEASRREARRDGRGYGRQFDEASSGHARVAFRPRGEIQPQGADDHRGRTGD